MNDPQRILVRATNWIGDAVMSLPALRALRDRFPRAHIAILAKPWVGDLYGREPFCNELIPYTPETLAQKFAAARTLKHAGFEMAILLPNAFEAAAIAWAARIPRRIGYARDGRGFLLTNAIPVPPPGKHERFYYLELLYRAGILDRIPDSNAIRLDGAPAARIAGAELFRARGMGDTMIGVSPGAAYGSAKRWLPERFAAAANTLAHELNASIAIFGAANERDVCEQVASAVAVPAGRSVHNFAGETSLREYINLAAACRVYLTNDSGPMHIASALGVPTVAVFGPTSHITTGPTGPLSRVIREKVECSPCVHRECPIDHPCMTRVDAARVAHTALDLLKPDLLK